MNGADLLICWLADVQSALNNVICRCDDIRFRISHLNRDAAN
jgi:hypothetical protein